MAKKTPSFSLNKTINRVSRSSVFDRLVKEIDAQEIPAKYIDSIIIQYLDGHIVELDGAELTHPVPMSKSASWENMNASFKKMKDVRVFISTEKLEADVNELVEKFLGKYC